MTTGAFEFLESWGGDFDLIPTAGGSARLHPLPTRIAASGRIKSAHIVLANDERPTTNGRTTMKIGVLALQGDFDAHRLRLEELGAEVVLVKKPEQLDAIDGLVIPGGESGTFLKLLGEEGFAKLKDFVHAKPTFGTCAGAILLAIEMVFIRAPKIEHVGEGVEILATEGNDPVAVRQGKTMAATFHPELSDDPRVHQAFLDLVRNGKETNKR